MRRLNLLITTSLLALFAMTTCTSCGSDDEPVKDKQDSGQTNNGDNTGNNNGNTDNNNGESTDNKDENPATDDRTFAYGADPSWITEMEEKGMKFYDRDGKEGDGLEVLKGVGFNAVRLRAWVNPANTQGQKYCDTEGLIAKAKRCQALGYKIMINLHYSDTWCDPKSQNKPAAWDQYTSIDDLAKAAADYTTEVFSKLKAENIDITWFQIGNETATGMMKTQSDGSEDSNLITCALGNNDGKNYATVHNKCREAAIEIYPDLKIVVHFQSGERWDKLSYGLAKLKTGGAIYDILGVSFYPETGKDGWYANYVDALISNLNKVSSDYGKDVMVCEIGCDQIATYQAKRAICNTVIRCKTEVKTCKGVFYWEPQCYGAFNGYGKGGFLSSGKPAEALDVFGGKITELLDADDPNAVNSDADVLHIANTSGEPLGTLAKQDDGTYSATITFGNDWENFTVTDKDGKTYGPKSSWDDQFTIAVAHGEFNHFWVDGKKGTYTITFDIEGGTWSQKAE